MERDVLVEQRMPAPRCPELAGTQRPEGFARLRAHVREEANHHPFWGVVTDLHIQEDPRFTVHRRSMLSILARCRNACG